MTDQDLFFTHTVVGQAMSVPLGRRMSKKDLRSQGTPQALAVNMATATFDLPQAWKDWCMIQGTYPYAGSPRRSPGRARRWLERHALILAVISMLSILTVLAFVALIAWYPLTVHTLGAAFHVPIVQPR
jgi:hypothetical protein